MWPISAHNFPNSGYFRRFLDMHLQRGFIYLCTEQTLLSLLRFWNYNPSPNGQIVSLIGAQAHLYIQLQRTEWY